MVTKEQVKKYFWFLFGVIGVVFFWIGIWDGIGNIWIMQNPIVSFLVGVGMFTLSGIFFKERNPFWGEASGAEIAVHKMLGSSQKNEFTVLYYDTVKKKSLSLKGNTIKNVEKGFLVLLDQGKETFIPLHRVKEVQQKGKIIWKGRYNAGE